jgi:hypothetical protein
MLPGPVYIYKCPHCENLLTRESLMSGNTFGATLYSDGRQIAPMLPEYPELTRCKRCNSFLWLSRLKEIGIYHLGEKVKKQWQNADAAEFLGIEDYFQVIAVGMAKNSEDELYIRQRIWWLSNDRFRYEQTESDGDDDPRQEVNLNRLLQLLDPQDINQLMMKAELYRNLGEFEKCLQIIESIDNDDLQWIKEKFISECKRKNRLVFELT